MATNPGKYTPERVTRIISALRAGNTRGASAKYGGISDETFSTWCKRHLEFLERVKEAEASAEVAHVANIATAAKNGNWTASAWWLERRRPDDWARRDRIDIVHTVRELAQQAGLDEQETAQAITEAEQYLKELQRAGRR